MSTETIEPVVAEDEFNQFFENLDQLRVDKQPIPKDFGHALVDAAAPAVAADSAAAVPDQPVVAGDAALAVGNPAVPADGGDVGAEPAVAQPRSDDAALLSRLADIMDRRVPPAPAAPVAHATQPPQLYSADEIKILQAYEKDWPDHAAAMALLMRGASIAQRAQIFQEVGSVLQPQQQTLQELQAARQLSDLERTIPDYNEVRTPAATWAMTDPNIPPRLRATYKAVIDDGEVSEVKWLVDDWRKATGKAAPTGATPAANVRPVSELSEAAKQAAASLAPIASKRTAVVTSADPVSFDDAWEKFSVPTAKA